MMVNGGIVRCWIKGERVLRSGVAVLLILLSLLFSGCSTNPVTGDSELALVSEDQELAIGNQQYAPSRQMQGGDYRLDPDLTAYVQEVGRRLGAVSDRKLPYEFVVLNDSTPNAWALPGGKIAVNRGLLVELESEAELAAVLGHEIVHAAARHGAKGIERDMLLQDAVVLAGAAARNSDYSQLAVGAATLGANLVNQGYSRDAESEADRYGMQYLARAGYDPQAAIQLQKTFVRLSKSQQPNWLAGLFASHPPSQERVDANRKTAQTLPTGGEIGRERYLEKTAHLRKVIPAYKAYDSGMEALKKQESQQALQLAEKAIRLEPREGLFYGLKGDALKLQRHDQQALVAYDKAVQLNPDYFKPYLQRGEALESLGEHERAQRDLKRSTLLLPTANAYFAMGRIAQISGEKAQAINLYRQAAEGSSRVSNEARAALVTLDLEDHPGRYLKSQVGYYHGRLIVSVENSTEIPVKGMVIAVRRRDGVERSYRLPGPLKPRQVLRFSTKIPVLKPADAHIWRSRAVAAEIGK